MIINNNNIIIKIYYYWIDAKVHPIFNKKIEEKLYLLTIVNFIY